MKTNRLLVLYVLALIVMNAGYALVSMSFHTTALAIMADVQGDGRLQKQSFVAKELGFTRYVECGLTPSGVWVCESEVRVQKVGDDAVVAMAPVAKLFAPWGEQMLGVFLASSAFLYSCRLAYLQGKASATPLISTFEPATPSSPPPVS